MIQTLVLTGPMPPNLNKYRNMHFFALNNEKKKWHNVVWSEIHRQGITPIKTRIKMTYMFFFPTKSRHDPDNFACVAKFVNDALVNNGVLIDDSFEYIMELKVVQGGISKPGRIEVIMEEIIEKAQD